MNGILRLDSQSAIEGDIELNSYRWIYSSMFLTDMEHLEIWNFYEVSRCFLGR